MISICHYDKWALLFNTLGRLCHSLISKKNFKLVVFEVEKVFSLAKIFIIC